MKTNKKLILTGIAAAIVLFAVLGYSIFHWLSADQNVVITYDSDLRDKIANNAPIFTNPPPKNGDFQNVSDELQQVNSQIKDGNDEQTLLALNKIQSRISTFAKDGTNPYRGIFQNAEGEIVLIEENLQKGKKSDAQSQIDSLLKELNEAK